MNDAKIWQSSGSDFVRSCVFFNFIPYFSFLLLVVHLNVLASESAEHRKLKNKIHNFSSKNIDTDMSTKWSLMGLYLEKYDDNYTFIKNPKLID